MNRYPKRFMILLIDFDGRESRILEARHEVPAELADRVFILGVLTQPERLKAGRTYEDIGLDMAKDCREGTNTIWNHELLRHNAGELDRLRERVRPILFE